MNTTTAQTSSRIGSHQGQEQQPSLHPAEDAVDYLKSYARQNPETVAIWCFCIGFIVGWKLKPW